MQIAPLSAMGLTNQSLAPNTTYNSAQAAAESSQFATMLKDLKEKAAGATSANHIVNEAASSKQDKALKDACKGFEGMFLSMMYKQMRATVPKDTLFG
jgi:flagellar protein FlgJ